MTAAALRLGARIHETTMRPSTSSHRAPHVSRQLVLRTYAVTAPARPSAEPQGAVSAGVAKLRKTRLITAVKTPYLPNGKFDLAAYDRLVETQIKHGVEGLIVGGTTGEGQLMNWDEHIMLIAHTVNVFGARVQVIGNTGSNCTREAVHATRQGLQVGMHAALQINPYYGKTSAAGLLAHFGAVLAEGPCILYNVPGRTGQDVAPATIEALAGHPHFVGIKECAGNGRVGHYTSRGVTVWTGNDEEAHSARHDHGATGVISVTSNIVPGLFRELMHGPPDAAAAAKLADLVRWLFQEPNPIALNTLLAMGGAVQPVFRLPYVPLSRAQREEGVRILTAIGLEHAPSFAGVRPLDDADFTILDSY